MTEKIFLKQRKIFDVDADYYVAMKCEKDGFKKNGFIRKKQRWRDNGGRSSLLFEIIR